MVMNPRTHPRGAPPDYTLPSPNPNPQRMTDALWWVVCMRLRLEPKSRNGGTYADKPGSHNIGSALPDYGPGDSRTDHSIRDPANRRGPWWRSKCAADDWTFVDAQAGDYTTIIRYTKRTIAAMRDLNDPRPDDTYFYILGQADNDRAVEGWSERDDAVTTSSDLTHLWHIHHSYWRDIVGSFPHMWAVLTIDMGWTVADWRHSLEDDVTATEVWTTDGIIPNPVWRFDSATNQYITATTSLVVQMSEAHSANVNTSKLLEAQAQNAAKLDALLAAQTGGEQTVQSIRAQFEMYRSELVAAIVAEAVPLVAAELGERVGTLTDDELSDAATTVERQLTDQAT
jgi:hypothetical protein